MRKILMCLAVIVIPFITTAQYKYRDSNHIGIAGGINQASLLTNNFNSQPLTGWNLGLSMRGNFYNDFDMVYAIDFTEHNFSITTLNELAAVKDVKYKYSGAQISLMMSYKIVENHISVELGPVLQVNGKLSLNENQNQNTIYNSTLKAGDIVDVNTFNVNAAAGVTAGIRNLRVILKYQYGVNNFFSRVNNDMSTDLKVHLGIVSASIVGYL